MTKKGLPNRSKSKTILYNQDFRDFIGILNKHRVDYCITGAYAVAFYAEPRFTSDIDFYISQKAANAKKIAEAIKEFFGDGISENLFKEDKVIVRIGVEPNKIELGNYLHGLSDEEIIKHRIKNKYGSVETYYIGLDDLIKNKGIIKDFPHRGKNKFQDEKDYLTLIEAKKKIRD